jgi:beta-glucuronidase
MKNRIALNLFLAFIIVPCWAQTIPAKTSPLREQIDLTGPWRFKADPKNIGDSAEWFKDETDKTFWPLVNVPVAFDHCGPELDRYFGTGWFCRRVYVPESFRGRRILIHFEGINYNAKVWVNGQPVGENHDAFLPFDLLINDAVITGAENSIAVSVNNIRQLGQFPLFEGWYGQGGFLREASLVATSSTYMVSTMMVATPITGTKNGQGQIFVRASVKNESGRAQPLKIQVRVSDKTGKLLAVLSSAVLFVNEDQLVDLSVEGHVPKVQWWSPDSPALYTVEVSVLQDGKVVDQQIRRTGFRNIEIADAKIRVNGKQVFLLGFNRHEDSPRTGMAVDLQQAREDFCRMKEIGCNYVRFCHYPHHPGELDLCDELGLFVLAENAMNEWGHIDHPAPNPAIPLEPKDAPLVLENARRTLTKMVARDNHHPSIIIWSVSNENEESRQDVALGNAELIQFGRTLDKSRPWTHVSNSFRKENWESFYIQDDVIVVNAYPTHWYSPTEEDINAGLPESTRIMENTLKKIHDKFPDKPIVIGEYGFPNGDAGEQGAKKQAVATEAEFKGLTAPYIAGGALWCFARHPWPWNNVSNYGYVSRDRISSFPAFSVVERLYKEHTKKSLSDEE